MSNAMEKKDDILDKIEKNNDNIGDTLDKIEKKLGINSEDLEGQELEDYVEDLVKNYGHLKVNLEREDGSHEGIWAVPCSQEDKDIYESIAGGQRFKVRLCNHPICTWLGKKWGHEIKAITNRDDMRPKAYMHDNFTPEHIAKYVDKD